jgi:hypothetical protein
MTDFATYLDKQTKETLEQDKPLDFSGSKRAEIASTDTLSIEDIKRAVQMLGRQGGNKRRRGLQNNASNRTTRGQNSN